MQQHALFFCAFLCSLLHYLINPEKKFIDYLLHSYRSDKSFAILVLKLQNAVLKRFSCLCFFSVLAILKMFSLPKGAPPLSSLEKDKDIDFDLLQDLMDVDIDPLDIDLEKDPLAAKVFKVCG